MKRFSCTRCHNRVFFENTACTACGATLGFWPGQTRMVAVELAESVPPGFYVPQGGLWRLALPDAPGASFAADTAADEAETADAADAADATDTADATEGPGHDDGPLLQHCANGLRHAACNWLVDAGTGHALCLACRLNRTIPDLQRPGQLALWRDLETEKRRLVYALLRLGLPVAPRSEQPDGMAFDFLAADASPLPEREPVLTGHRDGLITLNVAEADPTERERMRTRLAEPYRTLLGHFRHESAHHYWDRLVRDGAWLQPFRELFGDERLDYAEALERHYGEGPPADWSQHHVSAYASSHPWEDWAETWAHALLISDTLETAAHYGLLQPDDRSYDPYAEPDFAPLADRWLPLAMALNSLNRSMGHAHAYPFVLPPAVLDKLGFVHRVMRGADPPTPAEG
jgi:hypothetical protein